MTQTPPGWPRRLLAFAAILFLLAPALPIVLELAGWPIALSLLVAGTLLQPSLVRRLPSEIDDLPRRRPVLTVLWLLLWLVGTAQLARLGAFHADPSRNWASTIPDPEVAGHACMSAYVRAAELSAEGAPNFYAEQHWPALDEKASRASKVAGIGPWLVDPYQYPPTFVLVFRALLSLSRDFLVLRALWFLLQFLLLAAIYLAVARWVGEKGDRALWLAPAVLASLPASFGLQFGQVHLLAIAAALLGRVLQEKGKALAGSALLAAAIVVKVFPAILLIELAARRRFREIAQVAAFAALFLAAGIAFLGWGPHADFATYQVPRLLDGSAFAFFERMDLLMSRNFSPFAIPLKLTKMGLGSFDHPEAAWASRIFAALLLALAWRFATKENESQPLDLAIGWLALLSLAALQSPLAPSAYVLASPLWMLALLAAKVRGAKQTALLAVAWLAITGPPPLPMVLPEFTVNLALQLFAIALPAVLLWRRQSPGPAEA
jgi:hypothetical protein